MPVTLTSLSRRRFLQSSLALGVGLVFADSLPALGDSVTPVDPDRFVLFSDTHIDADVAKVDRKVNMTAHLTAAIAGVLATPGARPAGLLIDGDLAYRDGQTGDYAQFLSLIKPVVDAGVPVTMALGNHDDRARFWQAVPAGAAMVEGRQVTVIESARATWIVLDTLDKTNSTPGVLGPAQLKWLETYLDAHPTKPTLVMTHHNPDRPAPATQPTTRPAPTPGFIDGVALLDLLVPRKQVKALIYGHTHRWELKREQGLHLVNLPAVAYVFGKDQASGWTDWKLTDTGAQITLNTIDPNHAKAGTKVELAWR